MSYAERRGGGRDLALVLLLVFSCTCSKTKDLEDAASKHGDNTTQPSANAHSGSLTAECSVALLRSSQFSCDIRIRSSRPAMVHPGLIKFMNYSRFSMYSDGLAYQVRPQKKIMTDPGAAPISKWVRLETAQEGIIVRFTFSFGSDETGHQIVRVDADGRESRIHKLPRGVYRFNNALVVPCIAVGENGSPQGTPVDLMVPIAGTFVVGDLGHSEPEPKKGSESISIGGK